MTTGKRKWHYQTTHHRALGLRPALRADLFDVTIDGRRIKALALPTKQAFLFVLDRENRKPLWPIEERRVPQSTVPTRRAARRSPPTARPSIARARD